MSTYNGDPINPASRVDLKKLKSLNGYDMNDEVSSTLSGTPQFLNNANLNTNIPTVVPKRTFDWNAAADNVEPFVSNIVNMFRKAPAPVQPKPDNFVTLSKVNYNNTRNQAAADINASDVGTNRIVDSSTAASIRQFNLGRKLSVISDINEKEANQNVGTTNQQTMVNSQIAQGNNNKVDEFHQQNLERQIAQARESSQNIANMSDKAVEIGNEKRKAEVDKNNAGLLMSMYEKSGVLQRQGLSWKAAGRPDPFGMDWKWLGDPMIQRKRGGLIKIN